MSTQTQIKPTQEADDYPHQVRAFQAHAGAYASSMVLIFAVNLAVNLAAGIANQWSAWWSGWALIGWGMGLAIHGLVVFVSRPRPSTGAVRTRDDGGPRPEPVTERWRRQ